MRENAFMPTMGCTLAASTEPGRGVGDGASSGDVPFLRFMFTVMVTSAARVSAICASSSRSTGQYSVSRHATASLRASNSAGGASMSSEGGIRRMTAARATASENGFLGPVPRRRRHRARP